MRASILFAAPFAALALAQETTVNLTESTSTSSYNNPATSYLTQTNSLGVVTGMPKPATDVGTAAYTSYSSVVVQLVPAGLSAGTETTLIYGNVTAGSATSIIVSIGSSTTSIVNVATGVSDSTAPATSVAATTTSGITGAIVATLSGAHSSSASGSSGSSSRSGSSSTRTSGSGSSGSSTTASGASTTSSGAAVHVKAASALMGAGVFFAAFM